MPNASAADGGYGTPTYDRAAIYAQAIIDGVKTEMPDAAYFTREDLLQLSCLGHVSTITRYNYVCKAVRYSIERRWMMSMSRTALILTGGKRRYGQVVQTIDEYEDAVRSMLPAGENPFSVVTLLAHWTSDHHLTLSAKRTILREMLSRWSRHGDVEAIGLNTFRRVK